MKESLDDRGKLDAQHKRRKTELDQLHDELKQLREDIKDSNGEEDMKESLDEIDKMIDDLENHGDERAVSTDEVKAAMESLREAVKRAKKRGNRRDEERDSEPLKSDGASSKPEVSNGKFAGSCETCQKEGV